MYLPKLSAQAQKFSMKKGFIGPMGVRSPCIRVSTAEPSLRLIFFRNFMAFSECMNFTIMTNWSMSFYSDFILILFDLLDPTRQIIFVPSQYGIYLGTLISY